MSSSFVGITSILTFASGFEISNSSEVLNAFLFILSLIAAPEGIAKVEREHPDVPVFTAAKDERLNSHFYIVAGLGDAGDRIFGTL